MNSSTIEKTTTAQRVMGFLAANRKLMIGFGAFLLVAIVLAVGIYQFLERRAESATRAAELLDNQWQAFAELSDEEREASPIIEDLRSEIAAISEQYTGSYGDLRARFILASLEWELNNYEAAQSAYLSIVNDFPDSHLVGVSLGAAAAASEMLGQADRARELLLRLADGEGLPNTEKPRALFNLGRLAESSEDYDLALDYYNRLLDEHGESSWTNLGRDRIIWLQSQGLAADG